MFSNIKKKKRKKGKKDWLDPVNPLTGAPEAFSCLVCDCFNKTG